MQNVLMMWCTSKFLILKVVKCTQPTVFCASDLGCEKGYLKPFSQSFSNQKHYHFLNKRGIENNAKPSWYAHYTTIEGWGILERLLGLFYRFVGAYFPRLGLNTTGKEIFAISFVIVKLWNCLSGKKITNTTNLAIMSIAFVLLFFPLRLCTTWEIYGYLNAGVKHTGR